MIDAFKQLRKLYREFESARDALEKGIGVPICVPHCGSNCCEHNLPMFRTIEGINAVSVAIGQANIKQVADIAEGWLLERHSVTTIYEGESHGWASEKLLAEWRALSRSQCPFLDAEKRCMIYLSRPLVCRAYGVTRLPEVRLCPRRLGRGELPERMMVVDGSPIRNRLSSYVKEWGEKNKAWLVSGFVPTVIYRAARPEKYKAFILDNRIASAKIIGTEYDVNLMWQPQVDALRVGVSPDLIAARN